MSDRPERPEKHKPEHSDSSHARHEAYGAHKHAMGDKHGHQGEKHLHHVSIHDHHTGLHISHIHRVKKGETISGIARHELSKHGHHPHRREVNKFTREIMRANHIENPKHLKVGSELMIPEHRKHHAGDHQKHNGQHKPERHGEQSEHHKNKKHPHESAPAAPHHHSHEKPHHHSHEKHQGAPHEESPQGRKGRRSGRANAAPDAPDAPQQPGSRGRQDLPQVSTTLPDHIPGENIPPEQAAPRQQPQYPRASEQPAVPPARVEQPSVTMPDGRRVPVYPSPHGHGPEVYPSPQSGAPAAARPEQQTPVRPEQPYVTLPNGQRLPVAVSPGRPDMPADRVPGVPADRQPDVTDRPQVAPGAGALSGRTFVIDPGHGLQDTGARSFGVNEKDLVLPYAALLGRKLQAMGANVVYTRPIDHDGFTTWDQRTQIANQAHPDAVIRIHANDDPNHRATGLETYWMDAKDRGLAAAIHGSVLQSEHGTVNDRGVRQKDFHVHPQAPSALIELGYMTDRNELSKLMSPAYRNAAVDGMVSGLVRYVQSRG